MRAITRPRFLSLVILLFMFCSTNYTADVLGESRDQPDPCTGCEVKQKDGSCETHQDLEPGACHGATCDHGSLVYPCGESGDTYPCYECDDDGQEPGEGVTPTTCVRCLKKTGHGEKECFQCDKDGDGKKEACYEYTEENDSSTFICCPAKNCKSGNCSKSAAAGGANSGSAILTMSLGFTESRAWAGELRVKTRRPSLLIWTPTLLKANQIGANVQIIRDEETELIRQVLAPQTLVDVIVLDEFSYAIRFYPVKNGITLGGDGLYTAIDPPFRTWVISNPNASIDSYYTVTFESFDGDETAAPLQSYHLVWNDADLGWNICESGLRCERQINVWDSTKTRRTETLIVDDVGGLVAEHTVTEYQQFPWGERKVMITEGPDTDAPLVSFYSYYEDAKEPGRYSRLKSIEYGDGSWEKYDYNEFGALKWKARSWLDKTVDAPQEEVDVIYYDYQPHVAQDTIGGQDREPRTVTRKIEGVVVEKTYFAYPKLANGERQEIEKKCQGQNATYNDSSNLTTIKTFYAPSEGLDLSRKYKTIQYADGTQEAYRYERGNYAEPTSTGILGTFTPDSAGDSMRHTVIYKDKHGNEVVGRSTKKVEIYDGFGNYVQEELHIYKATDLYDLADWTAYRYNEFSQLTDTIFANGLTETAQWSTQCCGKDEDVSAEGIKTTYIYDDLGRVETATKEGVASDGTYAAQPDIVTLYTYDAKDRIRSETQTAGGLSLAQNWVYDTADRLRVETGEDQLTTTMDYSFSPEGGVVETITYPGNRTEVTTYFRDGQIKSVTGSSVVSLHYTFGVNPDGSQWTKVQYAQPNSPRWEQATTGTLGRTIKEEAPNYSGGVSEIHTHYNNLGQLDRIERPGVVDQLFTYDDFGEQFQQGLDENGNQSLDVISDDPIAEQAKEYISLDGEWWLYGLSKVYTLGDSDSTAASQGTTTRISGQGCGCSVRTKKVFLPSGAIVTEAITVDPVTRMQTRTITRSDSSGSDVSIYRNGLMVERNTVTGETWYYEYDTLGRQTSVHRDGTRKVGRYTYYNSLGQVDYKEDEELRRTNYTYDPATGELIAEENAINQFTFYAYTDRGELKATWGNTYPVLYGYNDYGRQEHLYTLRDNNLVINDVGDMKANLSLFDKTTWVYQESTGLLEQKLYADNKGPTYTYDDAGRLRTRLWARSNSTTTYEYNTLGQLEDMLYQDGATPNVTGLYGRWGGLTNIVDGIGEHHYIFNDQLQLKKEQLVDPVTKQILQTLNRSYDPANGRYVGLDLESGYDVDYGYDTLGRFKTITANIDGGSKLFTYNYESETGLLETLTSPNALLQTRKFEAHRDLLDYIQTEDGSGLLSKYDYLNDGIGRHTDLVHSGPSVVEPDTYAFGYNGQNELTSSTAITDTTYDYGYTYDPIGNRLTSTKETDHTTYGPNNLNQYDTITQPDMTVHIPQYDDDGNIEYDGLEWSYTWDSENRLVVMENPSIKLEFDYDYRWRRRAKRVYNKDTANPPNYTLNKSIEFIYDIWNLVKEDTQVSGFPLQVSHYVWGLDLSGTIHGAGGVSGLVMEYSDQENDSFYPVYDGNGNITGVRRDSDNSWAANYKYDLFGNVLSSVGPYATGNRFRFSSKYHDSESDLYYYGYRSYNPQLGRWINRDPLGEWGGLNNYGYLGNDSINSHEFLGLKKLEKCTTYLQADHLKTLVRKINNTKRNQSDIPKCTRMGAISCDRAGANDLIPPEQRITDAGSGKGVDVKLSCRNLGKRIKQMVKKAQEDAPSQCKQCICPEILIKLHCSKERVEKTRKDGTVYTMRSAYECASAVCQNRKLTKVPCGGSAK